MSIKRIMNIKHITGSNTWYDFKEFYFTDYKPHIFSLYFNITIDEKCLTIFGVLELILGFPGCSVTKNSPANSGDVGSIPGSGRLPGEGNGNPLQYSCLENSMYR